MRVASPDAKHTWPDLVSELIAGNPELGGDRYSFEPVGPTSFDGSITCGALGGARFARVAASPSFYKGNPVLGTEVSPIFIALQTNGVSILGDGVSRIKLVPGEWTLFDARQPFAIGSETPMEVLFVNLPSLRPAKPGDPSPYPSFRSAGFDGSGRIFAELTVSLFREIERLDLRVTAPSVDLLAALVSDTYRALFPSTVLPVDIQYDRIKEFVEDNLPDPELSPQMIADALFMSVRQVHRAFKSKGRETVSEYIWKRRVRKCSEELGSVMSESVSVTDIAFRWGFSSSPHFSRAFKEEMGLTASEFRRGMRTPTPG
ncbi:hypothetical protein DBB29_01585 [Pandoraea cepalis]|uniref:HTH araC/xylS-type domain-containing protein n=1 Tax=Pandoraea cepalis TaxID=2508294 RepID=A0AAW7MGD3_9BURK|nr:helix-turn-helix domain-containing protein [Pandoraea cepalis]MDN4571801.1 hypothetical protein [Pandoraea cepalis]MDN4576817.1 hypothetical protein [Pandoraea cepalis]